MSIAFTLCDTCLAAYRSLKFDPAATPRNNIIPFGDIFWSDEHPFPNGRWFPLKEHRSDGFNGPCYLSVVRLVSVRYTIWHAQPPTEEDDLVWAAAQSIIPSWPGFCRISYDNHMAAIQAYRTQQAAPLIAIHNSMTVVGAVCPKCGLHHSDYRLIIPEKTLDDSYVICRSCGCSSTAGDFTLVADATT